MWSSESRHRMCPGRFCGGRGTALADPDRALVEACQATTPSGLEGAFRRLYDEYKDRIYNVCYRITGNATDALDASQETFGIMFRKIGEFRFESKFSSWVYRIAVNASIDHKRRASTRWLPWHTVSPI